MLFLMSIVSVYFFFLSNFLTGNSPDSLTSGKGDSLASSVVKSSDSTSFSTFKASGSTSSIIPSML